MAPRPLPLGVLALARAAFRGYGQMLPPGQGEVVEIDMGPNGPEVVEMEGAGGPRSPFDGPQSPFGGRGGPEAALADLARLAAGSEAHRGRLEGPEEVEIDLPAGMMEGPNSPMAALARGLFPGPVLMGPRGRGGPPMGAALIEEGPPPSPFHGPDPLVMDMLEELDSRVMDQFLPALEAAKGSSHGHGAEDVCQVDLKKHCAKARSQIHCLGQHAADVSEKCRKEIDQSVPFLCSEAIDHYCDVLETGILSCLDKHMKDLAGPCKDAMLATKAIIKKASARRSPATASSVHQASSKPAHAALLQMGAEPPASHSESGDSYVGIRWKLFYMALLLGSFAITAYSLSSDTHEKAMAWMGPRADENQPLRREGQPLHAFELKTPTATSV